MLASYEATKLRYHILDTNAKNTQIFLLLAEIKKNLETILKKKMFKLFLYELFSRNTYYSTVPLGDWLEKKNVTAIIIKQQFGFAIRTT